MHINETGKALTQYMRELRGTHISAADQKPIWDAYFAATTEADRTIHRNKLYQANLPLVVHFVMKNHRQRGNVMDLIQEGNLGLLRAIEKFEPARGHAFSTYAMWWLNAYVNTAAKKMNSPVHIPLNLLRASSIPVQVSRDANRADSMPQPAQEPSDMPAMDPESAYELREEQRRARDIVQKVRPYLDEREEYVLLHYLLPDDEDSVSLQEIANKYNCSREWVRQCALKVTEKLRCVADGRRPPKKGLSAHSAPASSDMIVKQTRVDLARFGLEFFVTKAQVTA